MSIWATAVLGAGSIAWPAANWLACVTFLLGATAGRFQANAILGSAEAFRASRTMADVRQAMMSTSSGKLSIAMFWGTFTIAVLWTFAGKVSDPIAVLLCAHASFSLARELFSFGAVRRLAQVV